MRLRSIAAGGAQGDEARRPPPLGEPERQQLLALGADLERAWLQAAATAATRKRILRTAIAEVIVRRDGAFIHAVLHWQGRDILSCR
jgi:hypothetical protein